MFKKLLDFIDGRESEDEFTRELDEAVQSVRRNEKWRMDYMTLQMHYQEKYEQGYDEGYDNGFDKGDRKRAISVATRMIESNKLSLEDIAIYSGLTLEQVLALKKELQPV